MSRSVTLFPNRYKIKKGIQLLVIRHFSFLKWLFIVILILKIDYFSNNRDQND